MTRRQRTLMQRAYEEIRQRYMTLRLRPGDWIDDLKISEELELSRTPVREALFLLASEGLVLVRPGGGFLVRPLDLVDISNLFEAHVVVAKAVSRLTALRATPEELKDLWAADAAVQQAIQRRDPAGVAADNCCLHRLEAAAAHNEYFMRLAYQIHDQEQRLGYLAFGGADDWDELHDHFVLIQKDHRELIQAYEDRDPDAAEAVATRHVHLFRERIMQFVARSDTDIVDVGGDVLTSMAITASDISARAGEAREDAVRKDAVREDGGP